MFANISGYVCFICYIVIFSAESLMYRVVVLGEEAGAAMQIQARQRNLLITQEVAKLWILVKTDLPQITVAVFVVAAMEVIFLSMRDSSVIQNVLRTSYLMIFEFSAIELRNPSRSSFIVWV